MNNVVFTKYFILTLIIGIQLSFLWLKKDILITNIKGIPSFSIYGIVGRVKSLDYSDIKNPSYKVPCFNLENIYNSDLGDKNTNIDYQNNKFGLYIYSEAGYVKLARDLVNSKGGDWGYVLIPYNVKDYDSGKWKEIFDLFNKYHLIPIVQLWDLSNLNQEEQIIQSANFLNSMPWPIKNRYISVYNEVNDNNFWRGKSNPVVYAEILEKTIDTFKSKSADFFMLNGAFNSSARLGNGFIDERDFLIRMNSAVPGIFKKLDGWASHSYPQPNFSGNPRDTGRDSIKAYEWEMEVLSSLFGVYNIPVFITETGWAHAEGKEYKGEYLPANIVADYLVYAFENVWLTDPRVVAVTPFTIKYDSPYDHFSWIDENDNPYPQFKAIQKIKKIEGKPPYLIKENVFCD